MGLLYEFEQAGDGQSAVGLFSQLKPLLRDWPDLLKDFAAFLLPEQALECGLVLNYFIDKKKRCFFARGLPEPTPNAFSLLSFCFFQTQFEEQQAFDRSRRFLRQLEISFGENPSHYQKIVRALQSGTALSPAGMEEVCK